MSARCPPVDIRYQTSEPIQTFPQERPATSIARDRDPPAGFDAFWSAYPRKVAKQAALKAWAKLKPAPDLLSQMLKALEIQAASEQWRKDEGRFIPYPATWLNSRRWEDDLSAYQPGRDCGAGPPEPGSEPEFKLVSAPDGRRVAVKRRQSREATDGFDSMAAESG
jgi:hypothetical protein